MKMFAIKSFKSLFVFRTKKAENALPYYISNKKEWFLLLKFLSSIALNYYNPYGAIYPINLKYYVKLELSSIQNVQCRMTKNYCWNLIIDEF